MLRSKKRQVAASQAWSLDWQNALGNMFSSRLTSRICRRSLQTGALGILSIIITISGRSSDAGPLSDLPSSVSLSDELLNLAQECERHSNYDVSQRLYWKIIDSETNELTRLKAIRGIQRAVLADANRFEIATAQLLELAKTYEQVGRHKDAESIYAKLLETAPRGRSHLLMLAAQSAKTNLALTEKIASNQLSLAISFQRSRQFGDAQAAYLKALEITRSTQVERAALEGLQEVLARKVAWWTDLRQALTTGWTTFVTGLVPVLFVLALVSPLIVRRSFTRRKGQMEVVINNPQNQFLSADFESIIQTMLEKIRTFYAFQGAFRNNPTLPMIARPRDVVLAQIVEPLSSGAARFLGWALGAVYKPEFTLHVCYRKMWQHVNLLATLRRSGKVLRRWDLQVQNSDLYSKERDFAYEALMLIKKELN